jgi:hypothetical protein
VSGGLQAEQSSRSRFSVHGVDVERDEDRGLDSLVQSELEAASQGRPVRPQDVREDHAEMRTVSTQCV